MGTDADPFPLLMAIPRCDIWIWNIIKPLIVKVKKRKVIFEKAHQNCSHFLVSSIKNFLRGTCLTHVFAVAAENP